MANSSTVKPLVVAHRGARSKAPENTIEAIKTALHFQPAGIEFDVDVSKDGIPFVIHQETLELSSDGRRLQTAGAEPARAWVQEKHARELSAIDAGSWFSDKFSLVKIPTLEDVMKLDWGTSFALVELKDPYFWTSNPLSCWPKQVVKAVYAEFKKLHDKGFDFQVLSFNPDILCELERQLPGIKRVLAYSTRQDKQFHACVRKAADLGCYAIAISELRITREPEWLIAAHEHGLKVYVYERTPPLEGRGYRFQASQKQATWQKLLEIGVDAIETDFVEELIKFLAS